MEALSPDDVRRIDARYEPFPAFAAWAGLDGDSEALREEVARLEELRAQVRPEEFQQAVDVAMRAAAVDTGALEGLYETDRGFTMSVALQSAAAEIGFAQRGPEVPKLIAAHVRAYEYVLDAVTKAHPITETWIRELHAILTEPQPTYSVLTTQGEQFQPLPKGEYKTQPNHVRLADGTFFPYAPVDEVRPEMGRLVAEVTSAEFTAAHPVGQAAYAHYAFVRIHPFADGNGRVARALASVFTYRAYRLPLVLFVDQRDDYLAALRAADTGRPDEFAGLVRRTVVAAARMVTDNLRDVDPIGPRPFGLSVADVDAAASSLLSATKHAIDALAGAVGVPVDVRLSDHRHPPVLLPAGYRLPYRGLTSFEAVAATGVRAFAEVGVGDDAERAYVLVSGTPGDPDAAYFDAREIAPVVSTAARTRLDAVARRIVRRLTARP